MRAISQRMAPPDQTVRPSFEQVSIPSPSLQAQEKRIAESMQYFFAEWSSTGTGDYPDKVRQPDFPRRCAVRGRPAAPAPPAATPPPCFQALRRIRAVASMSPALAVVNLARIEVVRKWDYRHFGAQCLLVAHSRHRPGQPARPLIGEHLSPPGAKLGGGK
jgi:hypothetical protein